MGRTEFAGFPCKSYKTLQAVARKTTAYQSKINGLTIIQDERLSLPGIERTLGHPVLAAEIGALRACLMLLQEANDLFFCSYRSLHRPSLPWGGL